MNTTPNRFVNSWYSAPFFYLKFVDLASENSNDWQHNDAEGTIVLDLRNEIGVNAFGVIIQLAVQLWSNGASFDKIQRQFADN